MSRAFFANALASEKHLSSDATAAECFPSRRSVPRDRRRHQRRRRIHGNFNGRQPTVIQVERDDFHS